MTRNVPRKLQRADLLRRKRAQAASKALQGAPSPVAAVKVPSAAPRPPARRQAVGPIGRREK
jgi:hypothetical protein